MPEDKESRIVEVPQLDVTDILVEAIGARYGESTTALVVKIHPDAIGVSITLRGAYGGVVAKAAGKSFSDAIQLLQRRSLEADKEAREMFEDAMDEED